MEGSNLSSALLEKAVNEFAKLPGIGKKTALRLVLHLLKQNSEDVEQFGQSIITLRNEVQYCQECYNIADSSICPLCASPYRDKKLICVVESIKDVMAIEATRQFNGVYHVLGGKISPMDGIGPNDLTVDELIDRIQTKEVQEVILALSTTIEGDTTNFYIYRKISGFDVKVSTIARGISVGDELEYADELTLGRSILNRTPFDGNPTKS